MKTRICEYWLVSRADFCPLYRRNGLVKRVNYSRGVEESRGPVDGTGQFRDQKPETRMQKWERGVEGSRDKGIESRIPIRRTAARWFVYFLDYKPPGWFSGLSDCGIWL